MFILVTFKVYPGEKDHVKYMVSTGIGGYNAVMHEHEITTVLCLVLPNHAGTNSSHTNDTSVSTLK